MELTYNGLTNCQDIICFTGVPNLITYTGSSTINTKAKYSLIIETLNFVETGKQYYISLGDYRINSVPEIDMAGGTNFWLPQVDSYINQVACCQSIVRALRNLPYIAANYNVWVSDNDEGILTNDLYIEAKKPGAEYNLTPSWNMIPDNNNNTFVRTRNGASNDDMLQGNDNKISVDVYRYTEQSRIGETPDITKREYLTTLEKNYSGSPVTFNVTPILSTIAKEGEMEQFCFTIYGFSGGQNRFSHITEPAYITPGYQVNQSEPFIGTFTNRFFAANLSRGDERDQFNKTYLYAYYHTLDFSLYVRTGIVKTIATVKYVDSAGTVTHAISHSLNTYDMTQSLKDFSLTLDEEYFNAATYIDLEIPDIGTIRYNVIKPINATDAREAERIYWRNEYGGISFMDFTGERTEQRKEEIELYQKQNFDFYTADGRELTKVYSKKIPITVKHKTHNIDGNGKWLLFSLQNSSTAWTERNGQKYYIHIDDLEIKEASNAGHIYTGNITYSFSYPDLV